MILEEKLSSALEAMLLDLEVVAAMGSINTPFKDERISRPAVFVKITKGTETVQNTGIFSCTADIELRYSVKREKKTSNKLMQDAWGAIDSLFSCAPLNIIADQMNEIRSDIFIHSLEWTDSEPAARDGERNFAMSLEIGCANV
jgi:hypothetical protein